MNKGVTRSSRRRKTNAVMLAVRTGGCALAVRLLFHSLAEVRSELGVAIPRSRTQAASNVIADEAIDCT